MELIQFYQASFFCDLEDITPKPELIIELTEKLKDFELIPTVVSEHILNDKGIDTTSRLQLTTQKTNFTIRFEKNRLVIEQGNFKDMISLDEFILKAKNIFNEINLLLKRKGKRLSFMTSVLLDNMTAEKLNKSYKKIFIPESFYKSQNPFEWNTRQVALNEYKLKDIQEKINVITELSRVQGQVNEKGINKKIDRIQFTMDINTNQNNMSPRFDSDDFEEFLKQATEQFLTIKKEYEELLK